MTEEKRSKKALDYKSATHFEVPPEELIIVGLDNHVQDPGSLYDKSVEEERKIDQPFIDSVYLQGVLQPILVCKNGNDGQGKPRIEVIAGRRRTLALRAVNRLRQREFKEPLLIKCMVMRGSAGQLYGMRLAENAVRKNESILNQAENASISLSMGNSVEATMVFLGIESRATFDKYLKINELHNDVKDQIRKGNVSASAALHLATLPREQQMTELEKLLAEGFTSEVAIKRKMTKKAGKEEKEDKPLPREWRAILEAVDAQEIDLPVDQYKLIQIFLGIKPAARTLPKISAALKHVRGT